MLPVRSAAATLAASRYMDSQDEDGLGGTAGVIAPFVPWLSGRAELSRLVGDDAYRAWRYRLGPQLNLTSDAWLYPYFLRSDDNRSAPLSAAGLDANLALTARLAAQAGVSYATRTGGSSSGQGTAGITWTATPRLLLLAQAGVGRNSLLVTRSGPGGGGGVLSSLPIVGGRGDDMSSRAQTTEESAYETALSLGFRVLFP